MFNKYKNTPGRYFIYYLIFVFFVEYIGSYTTFLADNPKFLGLKELFKSTMFRQNYWWYNLSWKVIAVALLSRYYQNVLETDLFVKILKTLTNFFIVFSIFYIVFNWNMYISQSLTIIKILGIIMVLTCVILYFLELLYSDKILLSFNTLEFYVSAVILVWWLTTMPLEFYKGYFNTNDKNYVELRQGIITFANYLMNLCFSAALIISKPQDR